MCHFSFRVHHRKGINAPIPDYLSRLSIPTKNPSRFNVKDQVKQELNNIQTFINELKMLNFKETNQESITSLIDKNSNIYNS